MMQQEPQDIVRAINPNWDRFIRIAETIHYGKIEAIEFRGKKPRFVRLTYDLNFEDLADLQNKLDELRTLPLV